jgi:transposase
MNKLPTTIPQPPSDLDQELAVPSDLNSSWINESVVVRDDPVAGWRVVLVSGIVFSSYAVDDSHSERLACVRLRLDGFAQQQEIISVFGHSRATQHRWEQSYLRDGLEGLAPYRPSGRPVSVSKSLEKAVVGLHGQGFGMRRIAHRLGISIAVVRGVYRRHDLRAHGELAQRSLELGPGDDEMEEVGSEATDAADQDEILAGRVDGREEAESWDGLLVPRYESGDAIPWAGVLLALPVLRRHRVLEVFSDIYESLGLLAVYGLQTVVMTMVWLALWRVKRPEHLKGLAPWELGRVLGLPRVPEVKTVRRKLAQLADQGQARMVMLALAGERIRQQKELLGYLYVDGHVREYSGQYDLGKTYKMQRHMPVSATTDTWANGGNGEPLFVVTSELNEGLTAMLKPVLAEARQLAGEDRRITVVFDRGGWSPQLFVDLIRDGFDILTYRKGKTGDLDVASFEERTLTLEGRTTRYWLCDQDEVRVGNGKQDWGDGGEPRPLLMRQVTRLNPDNGHQTSVLTTRTDLEPEEVLWRMFARWRQENFFKYMLEEFAIDGLVEYGALPVDSNHDRPNPAYRALTKEIKSLKAHILRLEGRRCQLIGRPEARYDARSGFERYIPGEQEARQLYGQIKQCRQLLAELETKRAELPERISGGDLLRLRSERQQLATVFKIVAYRIESELLRLLAGHYARVHDEGRKLIAAALRSPADIEVTDHELRVTLAPQSSPHRSQAIAALCTSLNKLETTVPGTGRRLILHCASEPAPNVSS